MHCEIHVVNEQNEFKWPSFFSTAMQNATNIFSCRNDVEARASVRTPSYVPERYRDDGIILFNGTREQITELFEHGNSLHNLLKFTYEISEQELTFLDVSIYKGKRFQKSNILDVKSYIKPTNNFQYLHRESAHPTSVFKGLIKGECIRHMRNTYDSTIFEKKIGTFSNQTNWQRLQHVRNSADFWRSSAIK